MVDFQSRDTSRGLSSDDDEDEDDSTPGEETADPTEQATGDEPEETASVDTAEPATEDPPAAEGTTRTDETSDPATGHDHGDREADASQEHGHAGQADHDHGHAAETGHDHGHAHADHHHGDVEQLGVAVVTVSSSRDLDDDPSGDAIQSLIEGEGHSVVARDLVADDLDGVQRAVLALTGREDVDVVLTSGGTGVTPDDVTVEAVRPLFDKELPGFGELFRILSFEEVGTRAMGSRATAGVSEGVPVFCLPGSEDAVRTGVEELILAEAPHLVGLANGK